MKKGLLQKDSFCDSPFQIMLKHVGCRAKRRILQRTARKAGVVRSLSKSNTFPGIMTSV